MKIINMRTNHINNPLGFDMKDIKLSWIVENENYDSKNIIGTQVIIGLNEELNEVIFDSGICSDINNLCFIPNIKLQPRTRYYWKVIAFDDKDERIISEIAWFETSKVEEVWSGKWITPNLNKEIHPILRKEFNLPNNLMSARLYISGLGVYETKINNQRVSDEYLAPGCNSYDFWVQYQTYDITKNLKEGNNTIDIMLGNGWYKGRFGFDGGYHELYGDKFIAIAEIIVTLENGEEIIIGTDETWKCTEAPVEFSGIYDGEVYNSKKEIEFRDNAKWETVSETSLNSDKFQARLSLPVKIKETRKVEKLIKTPKNEFILDFGQNVTGWVKFKVNKPSGETVSLCYSEIMQNDCFYKDNLRTAKAEFVYISNGEEREIQPHFTYFGFRYVKLEGFSEEEINLDDFTACVVYSDIDQVGEIETSNKNVNKLFLNALWGQKGNFLDVPTDCPQRDERMGWTGDAQIFSMTACYNMYSVAFYTKFMYDLHEEQKRLEGAVPFIVPMIKPENDPGFVTGRGAAAWSDAATVIPWVLYKQYGDISLLEEQFDIMKSWVDYMKRDDERTGNRRLWDVGFQFGDWLALDGKNPYSPKGGTDEGFIASSYYYYSTNLLIKAAKALKKDDIAKEYETLASEIKEAINKEYFTENGRCAINTQTALIVALYMDLVNDNIKERVAKDLEKKLLENGVHLSTGFVGTPYFCNTLSENKLNEYAYTLLLNDDYPSWLYAVKLGATTIWERWNSVLQDGSIGDTGMNSLNHYAYGSIVEWMYSKMLGINPIEDAPGFKKFVLSPMPNGQLKYAKGSFNSPSGLIKSSWNIKDNGELEFEFNVPFNTEAIIKLPDAKIENVTLNGKKIIESDIMVNEEENYVVCKVNCGKYIFKYTPEKSYIIKFDENSTIKDIFKNKEARETLFNEIPALRGNDLLLDFLDSKINALSKLPVICNFVNNEQVNAVINKLREI